MTISYTAYTQVDITHEYIFKNGLEFGIRRYIRHLLGSFKNYM